MKDIFKRMKLSDQKGLTLIEILIAVAISTIIIGSISAVIFTLNSQARDQFNESVMRDDVRMVSMYLTNDIRYSQAINSVKPKELIVTDRFGEEVRYYMKNLSGNSCLARESDSVLLYQEIKDVNFSLLNEDLVSFDLITGNNNTNNFKVSRWDALLNNSDEPGGVNIEEIFIYSQYYRFLGNTVASHTGSIYVKGDLTENELNGGSFSNVRNIYIEGNIDITHGSASMGLTRNELGNIYVSGDFNLRDGWRNIYSNVYVGGNAYIKDAVIHGDLYINGDLELNWTPTFHGKAYYTGQLKGPVELLKKNEIKNNCIKVDKVEPFKLEFNMPNFRPDKWYEQKGYASGNKALSNNVKIYSQGSYSYNLHNKDARNVVIVSKGNITITSNWRKLSGVLFAPNGKVSLDGLEEFEGVIISRDGVTYDQGGSVLRYKSLGEFFSSRNDYPFE